MTEEQKRDLAEQLSGMVSGFVIGFERYSGVSCADLKANITIDDSCLKIDVGGVGAPDICISEFKEIMGDTGVLEASDNLINEVLMSEGANCEKH